MSFHKLSPIFLVTRNFSSLSGLLHILAPDHQHHVESKTYHKSQSEKANLLTRMEKKKFLREREECQRFFFCPSIQTSNNSLFSCPTTRPSAINVQHIFCRYADRELFFLSPHTTRMFVGSPTDALIHEMK